MALSAPKPRVRQTSTTTGTGTYSLDATIPDAYLGFVSEIGDTNTCHVLVTGSASNDWEWGIYTVGDATPDTIARTTVKRSTNGNSAVSWGAGTRTLSVIWPPDVTEMLALLGMGTGDSPQFTAINVGAASDTTIARSGAGDITVEGNAVYRAGGTDVAVADGGTGASTLTDGGILLGSGTGAITATAVLADSEMIVGDGTTDPVLESGATLRTSVGVGTGDSPTFTDLTLSGDLTVSGDDLTMGTNTSGAALIADGTNFNPVVISGDISINTSGVAAIGSGVIVNADVNASAAIADSKLATISTANKVGLAAIDIDGGTDIGAAVVAADLFIVDDGAGGTNRKTAASRIKTFVEASTVAVTGNVTASGTIEPAGDTATSDNAAIGYTSAEGLILTGQGSTNDVTIKNDADAEVMGVLTGTTTAAFTGQVTGTGFTGTLDGILGSGTPAAATVTTIDASGVATATTFEPDGDTAASDNAAIGYTSAEGLILTGQGSTNDVTIKNDADADVLEIPTGTTNVTVVGNITAGGNLIATGTVEPAGDTAASDNAAIGYTSAEGLILTGQGSTNDVTIKNDADGTVISIPTGTTNVTIAGDLTISGDDLTMGTNTSGAALIADGTNFNPVVISGDISINTSGVAAIGSGVIVEADIADNAVTLAKMAGGTDGNIISFDTSGNPVAVATGTDGQVLTSSGAGTVCAFEDAAGGGATDINGLSDAITNDSGKTIGLGTGALANDDGSNNENTAVGYNALNANTSTAENTAVGFEALQDTTDGKNTGVGFQVLYSQTGGGWNTAVGYQAMYNNATAYSNTAMGYQALKGNTSGQYCVGIGYRALYSNTTASSNTGIGNVAGDATTTGTNNTSLGNGSDASAADADNEVSLGNSSITAIRCQIQTITSLSDRRDKKDIEELPVGLAFINDLKPIKFIWNMRDGAKKDIQEIGFTAQDLDESQINAGAEDYLNLVLKNNPDKLEASYGKLVPILVKAVQELSAEVSHLKEKLNK